MTVVWACMSVASPSSRTPSTRTRKPGRRAESVASRSTIVAPSAKAARCVAKTLLPGFVPLRTPEGRPEAVAGRGTVGYGVGTPPLDRRAYTRGRAARVPLSIAIIHDACPREIPVGAGRPVD